VNKRPSHSLKRSKMCPSLIVEVNHGPVTLARLSGPRVGRRSTEVAIVSQTCNCLNIAIFLHRHHSLYLMLPVRLNLQCECLRHPRPLYSSVISACPSRWACSFAPPFPREDFPLEEKNGRADTGEILTTRTASHQPCFCLGQE